jgi:hypothetical protein
MNAQDNIADTEVLPDEPQNVDVSEHQQPEPVEDEQQLMDEFYQKLENLPAVFEESNAMLGELQDAFDFIKVKKITALITKQQKINEDLYALILDMNNLFVKKLNA